MGNLKDTFKKIRNAAAAGKAGASGAGLYGMGKGVASAAKAGLSAIKNVGNALLGGAKSALGAVKGAFGTAVSKLSNLMGGGSAAVMASKVFVSTLTVATTTAVGLGVAGAVANSPGKYDTNIIDCKKKVDQVSAVESLVDSSAKQMETAKNIYSVLKEFGLNDKQVAGCLGNWEQESQLDPTCIEGIYDEPYHLGPKKQKAMKDPESQWAKVKNSYSGGVNEAQYRSSVDGKHWVGQGLIQWTSGDRLWRPAEAMGYQWENLDFQVAFILATGTESTTGKKGGKAFFETYKRETASSSVDECSNYIIHNYEGITASAGIRVRNSKKWLSLMSGWSVDKAYASNVLSLSQKLGAVSSSGAVNDEKEKCAKAKNYDNSTLASAAVSYAWPTTREGNGNDGTQLFQDVYVGIWGTKYYTGQPMQSCDVTMATAIRWSGGDIDYPAYGTAVQKPYVEQSPKWQDMGELGKVGRDGLQVGDVMIVVGPDGHGHTWMYTGHEIIEQIHGSKSTAKSDSVSGSYNERSPGCGEDSYWYLPSGRDSWHQNYMYHVYRLVKPDNSDKYKSVGSKH